MASTYSTRLRLELMGSGDQSGTWGTTTNTNLGTLIEAAIAGRAAVSMTDADYTLTVANGTTDEARNMILNISGALTATRNVICPAVSKMYIVKNATTGGQSIIFKTSAGTGVTIGNGVTTIVFCDGTNVVEGINSINSVSNLTFTGTAARILGDFSNATLASRTAFQDKTTNNQTSVYILPNGTSSIAGIYGWNNSDPTNAAYGGFGLTSTAFNIATSFVGSGTALPMVFQTNNAEAARFGTDGIFYAGTTSFYNGGLTAKSCFSSPTKALTAVTTDSTGSGYTAIAAARQNSDGSVIEMWRGASIVGQIQVSASGTTYGTISDYRLKSNPQTLTGSGAFIDGLKPKTWTWEVNGSQGVGFIAHEAAQVAPKSVTGHKDGLDSKGNPLYQGMDYGSSEFIANIIAELQSLRARVAALEAK